MFLHPAALLSTPPPGCGFTDSWRSRRQPGSLSSTYPPPPLAGARKNPIKLKWLRKCANKHRRSCADCLVFGRLFNVFQSFRKTTEATDNLKYTHMSC